MIEVKKILTFSLGISLVLAILPTSANASNCTTEDIESVRNLFVPVIRISAHQGRNVDVNQLVRSEAKELMQSTESIGLKKQLRLLRSQIREGEANQGSVVYWGYREGSVWKTYLAALKITQNGKC